MSHSVRCPRCGGAVRPPDLMNAQWRCATCGSVAPLVVAPRVNPQVLAGLAGFGTVDAGQSLVDAVARTPLAAKIRVDGHPTPLWPVPSGPDRSVHVGEARAMWLYVIAWPAEAVYLLDDGLRLSDLVESLPGELVYGSDAGRLRSVRAPPAGRPTAQAAPADGE